MSNIFKQQLNWSVQESGEAFWLAIYQQAFPDMLTFEVVTDLNLQRLGVDRILYLSHGRIIRIDEKKRTKDYTDIAIETHHTKTKDPYSAKIAEGWISKPLLIDYLVYAVMPQKTVYFFDWLLLKRAWALHKKMWFDKFGLVTAENETYYSHSICVPILELQRALVQSGVIQLK